MEKSLRLSCLLFLSIGTSSLSAQDTPLERLSQFDEIKGWEAVGRVDQRNAGFCTGALIEPDIVLTAAHCLVDKKTNAPFDPSDIVFRAGYRDGKSVAVRGALQTVVHPEFVDQSSERYGTTGTDIGLVKLASPIPTVLARPFSVGTQSVGENVSVVSYARGRSEALSWQKSCTVLAKSTARNAAAYTCDVTFGASGSPVFDLSGSQPQIVSVMSRIRREEGRIVSLGTLVQDPIKELKQAFSGSVGVNMAGGGVASVVQKTSGARFVRPGTGARFVKP